jgi:hypothetical protein
LWCFTATAWKCGKTSPRTWTAEGLAVASRQYTVLHFLLYQGILTKNSMTVVSYPSYSPDLAPCNFCLFLRLNIPPFWHNWGDRGRNAGVLNTVIEHDFRGGL